MTDLDSQTISRADLVRQNMDLRRQVFRLEKQFRALAEEEQDGQKGKTARKHVLARVWDEVWKMGDPADLEKVLQTLREGLEGFGTIFWGLGINLIDLVEDPPQIRAHNISREGDEWIFLAERGREVILEIWKEGGTAYRPDLMLEDPFHEREWIEKSFNCEVRSVLDVPIPQGTLAVNSPQPRAFSPSDIRLIEDLAGVLSEGLQRWDDLRNLHRQKELLEEKNRLIGSFHRIGQIVLSSLDMDEILANLARQVIEAGIFRTLMLAMVDEAEGVFHVVRDYSITEDGQIGESARDPLRTTNRDRVFSIQDTGDSGALAIREKRLVIKEGFGFALKPHPETSDDDHKVAYFLPILGREGYVRALLGTASGKEEQEVILHRIEVMQPLLGEVAIALEHANLYRSLAEERERLGVTLGSIGDGVLATDPRGRITLLNPVAEDLTGWKHAEAIGLSIDEVFHHFRAEKPGENPVDEALKGMKSGNLSRPSQLVAKDGKECLVRSSCAPIWDNEGVIIGAVLVVRDITREHRMEEELHRARRIDSLGTLAGGIAHDFNNILASALVNVSVLEMQMGEQEELQQIVGDIGTSLGRARHLTRQLLAFTRGKVATNNPSSLGELVRETVRFTLRGTEVVCRFEIAPDLWPVSVDATQMSQVFQNLVLNANQAMPEGGEIRISLENLSINSADIIPLEEGRYIRCCIADQGQGIQAEDLEKIFDPYFTTKKEGNGLGLASAYNIVNSHGGWIAVESECGKGSRFTVYLPALESAVEKVVA
jgi:PAS domain S-box-containing protein